MELKAKRTIIQLFKYLIEMIASVFAVAIGTDKVNNKSIQLLTKNLLEITANKYDFCTTKRLTVHFLSSVYSNKRISQNITFGNIIALKYT